MKFVTEANLRVIIKSKENQDKEEMDDLEDLDYNLNDILQ